MLTYALLNCLDVIFANANASSPAQMPGGLPGQVLDHDATEYGELRLNVVKNGVIG